MFVVFLVSLVLQGLVGPGTAAAQSASPDKESAIAFLNRVVELLEAKSHAELEKHFYLPPNFKPEMFDGLLQGKVISRDGVLALQKAGDFGTANLIFGAKRAARKTEQAGAPADQCFAFKMEQGDDENYESCEVIMHWTEGRFKVVDLRGIGRMVSANATAKTVVPAKEWPVGTEPSKQLLLESLAVLLHHIENGHYELAKAKLYVPDDFTVSKFKDLIERRELSAAGIEAMGRIGKYGTASDVFGSTKATFFAERVDVPVAECFGMIAVADATGETMAHWKGDHFKFLRADDIGKLGPTEKPQVTEPVTSSDPAAASTPIVYEADRAKVAQGHAAMKASVEAKPEDVLLRIRYARSWLVLGNPIETWKELRRAIKDSAEGSVARQEAMRGIDDTLEALNKMQIFQVGVPQETMVALLGEPDSKTEAGNRWNYPRCSIDFTDGRIMKMSRDESGSSVKVTSGGK